MHFLLLLLGVRAICAWCRAEGLPGDLGQREPLEDPAETHGLCERHLTEFLDDVRGRLPIGLRLLIVVKRGEEGLYEYVARSMAGVEGVYVMLDRRQGERRQGARPMLEERRQGERRQTRGVQSIGCTFVRVGSTPGAPGVALLYNSYQSKDSSNDKEH